MRLLFGFHGWRQNRQHNQNASGPIAVKQIICLANSRKRGGRCIAGKERLANGRLAWVRPVSDLIDEAIPESEYRYADGGSPQLLDVIDVPVLRPTPRGFQSENWLIRERSCWVRRRAAEWRHLETLVDRPVTLWGTGESSQRGKNDRVSLENAGDLKDSLYLLHLSDIRLWVSASPVLSSRSERRLQASFTWHGKLHILRVTDPLIEAAYLSRDLGSYFVGECYATISLSLPFNGYCYKLVAAIMRPLGAVL